MAFRKKHPKPAPNKNQAKLSRRREIQERPVLGAVYPNVERLTVALRFLSPQGGLLGEKNLELGPDGQVDFHVECPGPCGDGQMDLGGKIADVIGRGETAGEGRGKCAQILYAGSPDVCGCQLHCQIEVSYRP